MERKHADQTGKKKRENCTEGKNDRKKLNCWNTKRSHGWKKANIIKKQKRYMPTGWFRPCHQPAFSCRRYSQPLMAWPLGRRSTATPVARIRPSPIHLCTTYIDTTTTRPSKTQRVLSRACPSLGYLPSLDKLIRRPRPDRLQPDTHVWSHTHD